MTKFTSNSVGLNAVSVIALVSIAALGGCGGGGGGKGTVVAVADPKPLAASAKPANIAIGANGPSNSGLDLAGLFFTVPDSTSVQVSDRSPLGGNGTTVSSFDENGNAITTVGGTLAGGSAPPATKTLQFIGADSAGIVFADTTSTDGSESALLLFTAVSTPSGTSLLNDSGYGMYISSDGKGKEQHGFVFGGNETARAEVPVTATYGGTFGGMGFANDGSAGDGKSGYAVGLVGDVALSLNASQGTVKGNVYNIEATDLNDVKSNASYGLAIDAKVNPTTGITYQGAVNFTNAATAPGAAAVAGATQSNVIGGFYGTGAAETTGALQVQGKAPGVAPEVFVSGAYGAVKN